MNKWGDNSFVLWGWTYTWFNPPCDRSHAANIPSQPVSSYQKLSVTDTNWREVHFTGVFTGVTRYSLHFTLRVHISLLDSYTYILLPMLPIKLYVYERTDRGCDWPGVPPLTHITCQVEKIIGYIGYKVTSLILLGKIRTLKV